MEATLCGRGRNFDDLAPKFKRKIYGGIKGRIRLAVIKRDLTLFCPGALVNRSPMKILDAGSGYGPFSLELARLGHGITLCDLSEKMLDMARDTIERENLHDHVAVRHCAIQDLPVPGSGKDKNQPGYDLVLCHAVLEWVDDPGELVSCLVRQTAPGGFISLTFYNLHGTVFKNLLRTNYKKIEKKEYRGWPGSLTPAYPRTLEEVLALLDRERVSVCCRSGIRVFHDYVLDLKDREKEPDRVVALELEFSQQMPYRDLGRYQHVLVQRI